jgi:hypothetical protein
VIEVPDLQLLDALRPQADQGNNHSYPDLSAGRVIVFPVNRC